MLMSPDMALGEIQKTDFWESKRDAGLSAVMADMIVEDASDAQVAHSGGYASTRFILTASNPQP